MAVSKYDVAFHHKVKTCMIEDFVLEIELKVLIIFLKEIERQDVDQLAKVAGVDKQHS